MIARELPAVRFCYGFNRHAQRAQIKDICRPARGGLIYRCAPIRPGLNKPVERPSVAAFGKNREGFDALWLDNTDLR